MTRNIDNGSNFAPSKVSRWTSESGQKRACRAPIHDVRSCRKQTSARALRDHALPNLVLVLASKLPNPKWLAISTRHHIIFDLASLPRARRMPLLFAPTIGARSQAATISMGLLPGVPHHARR